MNWRYFTVLLFVLMLVFTVIPVRDGIADVGVESIRTLDVTAGGGEKGRPLFVDGEVLVKFNTRASQAGVAGLRAGQGAEEVGVSGFSGVRRWRVPSSKTVEEFVNLLSRNPLVEYAEPNYIAYSSMVPNDPFYSFQWHFDNPKYGGINLEAAWELETGDPNVVVAVVDTGVAYEDFGGPGYWHLDTYNAYDGSGYSWWCGVNTAPYSWTALYGSYPTAPGYGNGWKQYLQRSFDLTTATGTVTLSYFYKYDIERNYDFFYVEVSGNGGVSWSTLKTYTNLSGGRDVDWTSDSVDLSGYVGSEILVRFRFNSDEATSLKLGNSDEDGYFDSDGAVYIDEVEIVDGNGQFFYDNMESGVGDWETSR